MSGGQIVTDVEDFIIIVKGFPGGKGSTCQCRIHKICEFVPGSGRFPGGEHGNVLQYSWRTPWIEEPGGLQSMGSQRAEHD